MEMLKKAGSTIGQVLALLAGNNFSTPQSDVLKKHPYLGTGI